MAKKEHWRKVIFAADCIYQDWDEDHECAECPVCRIDYSECDCPGSTQDDIYKYKFVDGVMYAKKKKE